MIYRYTFETLIKETIVLIVALIDEIRNGEFYDDFIIIDFFNIDFILDAFYADTRIYNIPFSNYEIWATHFFNNLEHVLKRTTEKCIEVEYCEDEIERVQGWPFYTIFLPQELETKFLTKYNNLQSENHLTQKFVDVYIISEHNIDCSVQTIIDPESRSPILPKYGKLTFEGNINTKLSNIFRLHIFSKWN